MLRKLLFLLAVTLVLSVPAFAQDAYQEAPMLAERVAAGELPPVAERLPENPLVVEPLESTGTYGGEIRLPFVGNPGWGGLWFIAGAEYLVSWAPDASTIVPNLAERWEMSEDATSFTFYLHRGIRWSDGTPFTVDDILFALNDIWLNEELVPTPPSAYTHGGAEVVSEKIDDYTFSLTFAAPNPLFLINQAQFENIQLTNYPKHWLSPYHADYNDDVASLVEAAGGTDWVAVFLQRATGVNSDPMDYLTQPDRPVLNPWVVTQPLGTGTQIVLERNPYYWKVDTAGNQLPYFDRIVGTAFQDGQTLTLAALNGEFDLVNSPLQEDRPLYFQNAEQSNLTVYLNPVDAASAFSLQFNRTAEDPVKAEIFGDLNFRIGMSHAIHREEVNEIIYFGQAEPAQLAPSEDSPLYNEQLATQYTEYNVDLANEYLDMVIPDRDAEGFRLRPDGERLSIVFTVDDDGGQNIRIAELLVGYWREVGVEVVINAIPADLRNVLRSENGIEFTMYSAEGGAGITAILEPRYYVPIGFASYYAMRWALWYENPEHPHAEEPPLWVQDQVALYQQVLSAQTDEERLALMQDVLQIAADQFYVIGVVRPIPVYTPVNADFGNIPDQWVMGWITQAYKITRPETWYNTAL